MRKTYVMGNWKMNTSISDAMAIAGGVMRNGENNRNVNTAFFPPSLWLVPLKERYNTILLGAQNVNDHLSGAYTGEISVEMLRGIAKYVLIGHSERRAMFNEDDATVNSKLKTVLQAHLLPVVAVGEEEALEISGKKQEQINSAVAKSRLGRSLVASTRGLSAPDWERTIIAYEPVWAIGTGRSASGHYAASIIVALRELIASKAGRKVARKISILYGGSVTRHSAADFAQSRSIDGVLVGGASLKVSEFSGIIDVFSMARAKKGKK